MEKAFKAALLIGGATVIYGIGIAVGAYKAFEFIKDRSVFVI